MMSNPPLRPVLVLSLGALALAACSQQTAPPAPPPPPPPPISNPAPPPPPPPPAPTYDDWRNAPATAGAWRSIKQGSAPAAADFRTPAGDTLVEMRCDAGRILIRRAGAGSAELPMTFRTFQADGDRTTDSRTARPAGAAIYEASVPAVDPVLDRIAFSRGRFTLEVPGLPTLYLANGPAMARVIQECRG